MMLAVGAGQAWAADPPGQARLVRAGQGGEVLKNQYDELTGLWFSAQVDQQGRLSSEIKGRELQIRKALVNGQLSVEIRSGSRALSILASRTSIELKSGRRTVRFDPTRATDANYDAAKQLLAESRVVSRLRAAVSAAGTRIIDSPQGTDLLLSEALIAMLDGDPGATERVRERIRSRMFGTGLTVAGARAGLIGDCFDEYRNEVYSAQMEAERCVEDFSIWNVPMRNLCNLQFTMRAEAAWFEFLGCSFGRALRIG